MARAAKAGASIAAAGLICAKLYDANPPKPNTETEELIEDYGHYIKFRQQRRPDIWNNRERIMESDKNHGIHPPLGYD